MSYSNEYATYDVLTPTFLCDEALHLKIQCPHEKHH